MVFGRLTALVVMGSATAVLSFPVAASGLEQTLLAPDGATNDEFASSVAIEGDTIVVGSRFDDGNRGAIYVFERSGDTWASSAKLTASDGAAFDQLGESVAIDGDMIVAGAPGADAPASAQGAVYTFARTGGIVRNETAKLTTSDGLATDLLGGSVAIDGEVIVAGANLANGGLGAVYTFARTGSSPRTETAKLVASDGLANDGLGSSVAVEGETIVAGASTDDVGGEMNQGSAYTFASTGVTPRSETARLFSSDGAGSDQLGTSVAIAGDTIVAGASGDDIGTGDGQGSVYTFGRSGPNPRFETAKLTASDGADDDVLGVSVAAEGETIVAGAYLDDVGAGMNQGSAYTFARAGAPLRTETARLSGADSGPADELGRAVAVDGTTIVAGAPAETIGSSTDQGSARVFFDPAPVADTTPPETSEIKGRKKVKRGKKPRYRFSSNEEASTFECRVDKKPFKPCSSPFRLKTRKLRPGPHKLNVRAVDAAHNVDPTPARRKVRVRPAK